jgi:bla regulator protein BlaR1
MTRAAIGLLMAIGVAGLAAQKPAFAAVTIARNVSRESTGGGAYVVNGRLRMTNVTLNQLMLTTYWAGTDLAPSQIVGGPAWVDDESYDVTATVGPEYAGKTTAQMLPVRRLLLQSLLEDRFKLTVHRETRELPKYALVMVRSDGSLGQRLQRPSPECQSAANAACAVRVVAGRFSMGHAPLAALVNYLARTVVRTVVVDRTGLQGMFALNLEWSADQPSTDKPSIFIALQDQLGLKLEPERGLADVVVIDHVEKPTLDQR